MKESGLQEIMISQLRDLLDAEKQLVRALPRMARWASHPELENAFREHLDVTKGQVQRLEQVFETLGMRPRSKPCAGMKGLVEEGQEIASEDWPDEMKDPALLGAGRKVEHYEMAGYTSAMMLAKQLGMRDAARLLQETLREEMETDRKLARLSSQVLREASLAAGQGEEARAGVSSSRPSGRARGTRRGEVRGPASSRRGREQSSRAGTRRTAGRAARRGRAAHPLTDHDEIRRWAEERGGRPACVKGTGGRNDTGMIRLDFPGYSGAESLQPISWDQWFEKFDRSQLALMVQEETARGDKSNFNKLVSRETAATRGRGRRGQRVRTA